VTPPYAGPAETPGLQAALARLLTDEELLERFAGGDTEEIRRRFGLSGAEHGSLTAVSSGGLRRYAHSLRIRRLRLLEALLPVTTSVVTAHRGAERTASEFCAAYPRRVADEGEDFRERNAAWFTEYVLSIDDDRLPAWFGDIARYEAIRARLACGRAAHEAVGADEGDTVSPGDGQLLEASPRVPANVELAEFGHDVLTLLPVVADAPEGEYPPQRTWVLVRRLREWRIDGYRLGASAYRILTWCTGAATAASIADRRADETGGPPEQARRDVLTVIRAAHRQGFLTLGPVPA